MNELVSLGIYWKNFHEPQSVCLTKEKVLLWVYTVALAKLDSSRATRSQVAPT